MYRNSEFFNDLFIKEIDYAQKFMSEKTDLSNNEKNEPLNKARFFALNEKPDGITPPGISLPLCRQSF
jgi:hypothetical protein